MIVKEITNDIWMFNLSFINLLILQVFFTFVNIEKFSSRILCRDKACWALITTSTYFKSRIDRIVLDNRNNIYHVSMRSGFIIVRENSMIDGVDDVDFLWENKDVILKRKEKKTKNILFDFIWIIKSYFYLFIISFYNLQFIRWNWIINNKQIILW